MVSANPLLVCSRTLPDIMCSVLQSQGQKVYETPSSKIFGGRIGLQTVFS